jgi:molecular chaperone Hsp33
MLHRFLFEHTRVRGEWVHLDAAWQALLQRHQYPPVVRDRLGEAYAAVALMAATLKFDGSLILQITGSGPLHMLVVQATGRGTLRGLARYRGDVPDGDLQEIFGPDGRLVITLDPGVGRERYQGVVALEGSSLAGALDLYFERSEQLPTRVWLASDGARTAGLLLQGVPGPDGAPTPSDSEDWVRATLLSDTVSTTSCWSCPRGICCCVCSTKSVCGCSRAMRCASLAAAHGTRSRVCSEGWVSTKSVRRSRRKAKYR